MSASAPAAGASTSAGPAPVSQQSRDCRSPPQAQSPSHQQQHDDAGGEKGKVTREPLAHHAAVRRVQLHRHALESIFACLDLAALATAMTVSRDWQAAVGSMRSINSHVPIKEGATLQQLVMSRMRRHVTGVNFWRENVLTGEYLALLHERMPHLRRIRGTGLTIADGVEELLWPPQLQQLELHQMRISVAEANMLLRSIGSLSQLRDLSLNLQYDASLSFAPLASLSVLRHLRVLWGDGTERVRPLLTHAQMDQLRLLGDLDELTMQIAPSCAVRLLRQPHTLQWKQQPFWKGLDDAACALLLGLTSLTMLNVYECMCTNFDWLPRMPSLIDLRVDSLPLRHPSRAAATQSLLDTLQQCPRITSLALHAEALPITLDLLTASLSNMPVLTSLHMKWATLPSLSFLAVPSLSQSLRELWLEEFHPPRPPVSELHHLHGLRELRSLLLHYIMAAPLDAETRARFEPPSQLLPHLEYFEFEHLDEDEEDAEY